MIKLTKTKLVAMLLVASTLVMFNSVSAHAETKTLEFYPNTIKAYISSNAYQYYADASTYAGTPGIGIRCKIESSQYSAKHTVTGAMYYETKSTGEYDDYAGVSFIAPSGYETSTIATAHHAYYNGYVRTGNTAASH